MKANFDTGLAFVWRPGFDDPADGYHTTPGDTGGGTYGGVIDATWRNAVQAGIVRGELAQALVDELATVLEVKFWQGACDALPSGIDLLLFNGRMMTGRFAHLFQMCCGFTGDDVDGDIGPTTLKVASKRDPVTLIGAITGAHYAYLSGLEAWHEFGAGWTKRLLAAEIAAIALTDKVGAVA